MILYDAQQQASCDAFGDLCRAGSGILRRDIEGLFVAYGGEISEGRGSRVRVALNGVRAVFHRPHPQRETDKGAVKSVRRFLLEAEVEP